jgi:1-phosphatidylinositol-4-phosphate 5-kinase
VFAAGKGAGKSGSFFFFSHDSKFMIKTLVDSELKLFLDLEPKLATHHKAHPSSLIAKILGVFTVKSNRMGTVHIMLMENTLHYENSLQVKYVFDLKGSTIGRKVNGVVKRTSVLKDINFKMITDYQKGLAKLKR